MLKTRVLTALVLIPLILVAVYAGDIIFFALVTFVLVLAGYELFQMMRAASFAAMPLVGCGVIALLAIEAYISPEWFRPVISGIIIGTLVIGILQQNREGWLVSWALTLAGALYIGGLGGYFLLVRALPNGMLWTTLALVTAWMADAGAYFVGTRLGKHKFFPRISPKKTWEGAIGGALAASLTLGVLGWVFSLPLAHCLVLGLLIGLAAILGDLAESLLKRQTGVKDSSNLIPGHGGMLDRLDSLLFTAVVTYYYLVWVMM